MDTAVFFDVPPLMPGCEFGISPSFFMTSDAIALRLGELLLFFINSVWDGFLAPTVPQRMNYFNWLHVYANDSPDFFVDRPCDSVLNLLLTTLLSPTINHKIALPNPS
jgi:hypothetical protein